MSQFSNRFFIISALCFTAILGCNKDSDENGDSQFQGNQWETKIAPEYNLRPLLSTSDLDTLRAHMTSLAATPLGLTMTSALDGELENKCTPISQACAGCPAFSMPEDTSSWWSFDKSYFGSEVAAEGIEASHISSTFEALRTNVPCLYQDMGFTEADLAGLLFEIHLAGAEENQLASSSYYEAPYFYLRLMAYSGLDFDMAKSLMESETSNQTATEDNPRLKQVLQVLSYLTSIENTPDSLSAIEISQVEGETEPQVIVKAEFVGWGWCGAPMTEPNCQDRNSVHVVENNEVSTQEIEIAVGDLVRTKVDLADISKEGQSCMLMGEVLAVNDNGEDETTYDLKVIAETPNYIEMLESCQNLDGSDLNHDDQITLPLSDLQYLNCVDQDPSVIPDDVETVQLDDKHWSAPEFVIAEGTYQWDDFLARMLLMANKCKLNQLIECSGFTKLDLDLGGLSSLCYSKWANRDALPYQYNRCGVEFCDCEANPYQNTETGNADCLYESVLWDDPDLADPVTVDDINGAQ